jgi:hypothetical protein
MRTISLLVATELLRWLLCLLPASPLVLASSVSSPALVVTVRGAEIIFPPANRSFKGVIALFFQKVQHRVEECESVFFEDYKVGCVLYQHIVFDRRMSEFFH